MAHTRHRPADADPAADDLAPYALVEQQPLMEGRQMVMMMAPKKK